MGVCVYYDIRCRHGLTGNQAALTSPKMKSERLEFCDVL